MTPMEEQALSLARRLARARFAGGDAFDALTGGAVWSGPDAQEDGLGPDEARSWLNRPRTGCSVREETYQVQLTGPETGLVTGGLTVCTGQQQYRLRATLVCRWEEGEARVLHAHFSAAGQERQEDALRRLVEEKSRQVEQSGQDLLLLTENIPGGVLRCKNDRDYTILTISDSFLRLFGYERGEILRLFGDHYALLIHCEDRERVRRTVDEQVRAGGMVEAEYRARRKDGQVIWVLEKSRLTRAADGSESFYCVLVDITRTKIAQEELRLSEERHRIIMDQTTDIIFEWRLETDELIYSANWEKKFGYPPITKHISVGLPRCGNLHPEDRDHFLSLMREISSGAPYLEEEFRIRRRDGVYLWCKIRATALFEKNTKRPFKVVGVILDIDDQKRLAMQLRDQAERDTLTGLYNRGTAEHLIESYLGGAGGHGHHAMLIVDLDNFKQVNDRLGHLYGDAVLTDTALTLQGFFRSTDIISRIGGDEFLAFIKDIEEPPFAMNRAREALNALSSIRAGEHEELAVTASIGIALYPDHGGSFLDLYRAADMALYTAKNGGRGRCAIHGEDTAALRRDSAVNVQIDSDRGSSVYNAQLTEYVFRVLYEAADVRAAVALVLEVIGKHYGVSRVYIFENSPDGRFCSNTFEWCGRGVEPQKSRLQRLSYEDGPVKDYESHFGPDGVFYCRDVAALPAAQRELMREQSIVAMLQCAMRSHGQFLGFIGFDECRPGRVWTQEQADTLAMLAKILSLFLLTDRVMHELVWRVNPSEAAALSGAG